MSDLWNLFRTHTGRNTHKYAQYFQAYERHLAKFRDTACVVMEIGIDQGGFLEVLQRWLGPQAMLIGIDVNPASLACEDRNIRVFTGSQSDRKFLGDVLQEIGYRPDVVIDDGSHHQHDIRTTFEYLYPQVTKNGVYIVEDTHTSYLPRYGGGGRGSENFVELAKGMVDALYAFYEGAPYRADEFAKTTTGISFYDSLVVFDKGMHHFEKPVCPSAYAAPKQETR